MHSNATGASTILGGETLFEGAECKPACTSSLLSLGRWSLHRCILLAMASSVMWTTNSPVRAILTAVSLSVSSCLGFMLTIITGGSSPSMLNKLKGAALMTPFSLSVVIKAMGLGTIKLAISLYL